MTFTAAAAAKRPATTPSPLLATASSPMRTCPLCSREFGSASISIHMTQCQKKWQQQNDALPRELRRQMPDLAAVAADPQLAWDVSQSQLVPCATCGRTFAPERIDKHMAICSKLDHVWQPRLLRPFP